MRLELPAPGEPGKDPPTLADGLPIARRESGSQTFHEGISFATWRTHLFRDMTKNLGNTGNTPQKSI